MGSSRNEVTGVNKEFEAERAQSETIGTKEIRSMMDRYVYSDEIRDAIQKENLLPTGLLNRLHAEYFCYSGLMKKRPFLFSGKARYGGVDGFGQVCRKLQENGIELSNIEERKLFIEVYRFLVTRHTLNLINWEDYENDPIYHLVIPQPGMLRGEIVEDYLNASSPSAREEIVRGYLKDTNPHDGKQLLNKPSFVNSKGYIELLDGSQHKYPQCQLILDKSTQKCFSYCTYCFRHAQVRGDEDMFIQEDVAQVHRYLAQHPEVSDLLITGGDAGFLSANRLKEYVLPLIEDPRLGHVRTVRLGSRALTYDPEIILGRKFNEMLNVFDILYDHGIQLSWMAHFSTPRELLNPSCIAAIRRLKAHGVMVRSQSPIMYNISLFKGADGKVDIEKSAQNWIDLANILAMLGIGFHSMYCARPTGEHHYFAAPLADIEKVFSRIYRSLSSINRPSRHISMTISAGKLAIIGTTTVAGRKCFALKFTEARNMEWMDQVFLAEYDETVDKISLVKPFGDDKFFFEDELKEIEHALANKIKEKC